jgi:hypothetical protein
MVFMRECKVRVVSRPGKVRGAERGKAFGARTRMAGTGRACATRYLDTRAEQTPRSVRLLAQVRQVHGVRRGISRLALVRTVLGARRLASRLAPVRTALGEGRLFSRLVLVRPVLGVR